jgi:signal transduction histidine kinase
MAVNDTRRIEPALRARCAATTIAAVDTGDSTLPPAEAARDARSARNAMQGAGSGIPKSGRGIVLGMLGVGAAFLALATWQDVRSGTRVTERLMLAQAQSIADLVTESGSHGFEAYRRWEDEIASRLLDNARWVARLDSTATPGNTQLAALAELHDLGRINLFDALGNKVASSRIEPEEGVSARHDPRDFIAPILRGETRELRIGFKEARFHGGSRFAVAVARRRGGAVVINVFADSMRATLESVQPAHLLGTLGTATGVRYVALQSGDSLIGASWDSTARITLPPAADAASLVAGQPPRAREWRSPLGRVYEVSRMVSLIDGGPALLRVGLDPTGLERARADIRNRAWIRMAFFLVASLLAMGALLIWQRHGILEVEVKKVRAELEGRQLEAQRIARLAAMGELSSHVAHEIRNPLNTIHLTAQSMARDPSLSEDLRSRAEDLRAESRRIETIVQQFLEVARPRAPRLERLDVGAAVTAAGRAARAAFDAAEVALEVRAETVAAQLDPVLLGEILDNLLRNAREASRPGQRVVLSARRSGAEAVVEIEDEGPGVPAELEERIFDLYFTTKPNGTGLGLSLVAQMAAAMGGGVRLGEASAKGARFLVHFPAEKAA